MDGNGTLIIVSEAIAGLPHAFSGKNYIPSGRCLYFVRLLLVLHPVFFVTYLWTHGMYFGKYACNGFKFYVPQHGLYFTLYGSNCTVSTERGALTGNQSCCPLATFRVREQFVSVKIN